MLSKSADISDGRRERAGDILTQTNATTKAIVDFLNLNGHVAFRNNTVGIWDAKKRVYRRLSQDAVGVGDVLCCLKGGHYLEIEVKTGKDKLSPKQIERGERIIKSCGMYWTVGTFGDFNWMYDKYMTRS